MADYRPIDITVYPPIFQQFATYKTVIQGRSSSTIEDYLSDLSLFFRVYKHLRSARAIPLEEITLDDVDLASDLFGNVNAKIKMSEHIVKCVLHNMYLSLSSIYLKFLLFTDSHSIITQKNQKVKHKKMNLIRIPCINL